MQIQSGKEKGMENLKITFNLLTKANLSNLYNL